MLDTITRRMYLRGLTSCEILKQPGQFSGYKKGQEIRVSADSLTRLYSLYKVKPVAPKAEYFHASTMEPWWASKMDKIGKIGYSVFYKSKNKEK